MMVVSKEKTIDSKGERSTMINEHNHDWDTSKFNAFCRRCGITYNHYFTMMKSGLTKEELDRKASCKSDKLRINK